jgi:NAD(P)-dependent dehydrogenase (short-subunit alcohol dehydrogenase family)
MSTTSPTSNNDHASTKDMKNKIVVLTGANSGVGFAAAHELARRGGLIAMVCRDQTRGTEARRRLAEAATGRAPALLIADLSSQAAIRHLAEEINDRYDHIDVLINNAGGVFDRRELTVDGIEKTLATNHLAPFLLTHLLLPLVIAAPGGRIVAVGSEIYSRKLEFENLQGEQKYGFLDAYKRSKLGNVLFTGELARRLQGSGVTANAVSPGPAKTRFGDNMHGRAALFPKVIKRMPFFKNPEKASRTIVYAASSAELDGVSGRLYMRGKELKLKPIARDRELAARLWTVSEQLCHIDPRSSAVAIIASHGAEHHV